MTTRNSPLLQFTLTALLSLFTLHHSASAANTGNFTTPVANVAQAAKPAPLAAANTGTSTKLWLAPTPIPKSADLPQVPDVQFHVIKKHEPSADGYDWLHGIALAFHNNKLYAFWGHNKGAENTPTESARGSISTDNGKTWSAPFTIEAGNSTLAISHGALLEHKGKLWAFAACFREKMQDLHTRAYLLDDATGNWLPQGPVIADGFWPLQTPQPLPDGNWIMSGISRKPGVSRSQTPPAIAISRGSDFTQWKVITLNIPKTEKIWGESNIILTPSNILLIARLGRQNPLALSATGTPTALQWTPALPSNLPMSATKPCAGTLSNGIKYLIGTTTADASNNRHPLTIALGHPNESGFRKIYKIRDAIHPASPGESNEKSALSYPYAIEHENHLYIAYSNSAGRPTNRNSAELAIIPLPSLSLE